MLSYSFHLTRTIVPWYFSKSNRFSHSSISRCGPEPIITGVMSLWTLSDTSRIVSWDFTNDFWCFFRNLRPGLITPLADSCSSWACCCVKRKLHATPTIFAIRLPNLYIRYLFSLEAKIKIIREFIDLPIRREMGEVR